MFVKMKPVCDCGFVLNELIIGYANDELLIQPVSNAKMAFPRVVKCHPDVCPSCGEKIEGVKYQVPDLLIRYLYIMDKNIRRRRNMKINKGFIFSVALDDDGTGVLVVGEQIDGKTEVINAFEGKEAWDLFNKLTIKEEEKKI